MSPDEIPDRPWNHDEELLNEIMAILQRNSTRDMPLADLFRSILAGEGTKVQRARFGHGRADMGRKMIVRIIQQYAQQTGNWSLMRLLDSDATRPEPRR